MLRQKGKGFEMEMSHDAFAKGAGSHIGEGQGVIAPQGRRPHVEGKETRLDREWHVEQGDMTHGGEGWVHEGQVHGGEDRVLRG